MNKVLIKIFILCLLISYAVIDLQAQSNWVEWKEDISEAEDISKWQEQYESLSELAEHPFNINTITREQLEQLPFLSDKMIENILYYIYKYGPMVSKKELLGVEGMDWQTRKFLEDFIYIGKSDKEEDKFYWKDVLKHNKQELLTRVDIPLYMKSGYAGYDKETLEKYPNRKYYGDPVYHNLRYRFQFRNQLYMGFTAEKDAGEPFFSKYNKKGYDFYAAYVFLQDVDKLKALAIGNYRVDFGYGLVINTGGFSLGKSGLSGSMNRFGKGISKYSSTGESNYLQGIAATYTLKKRWTLSAFYSFRKQDARIEGVFIRSLKTDGYHRLKKDMEKKNTINNQLVGSNLSYNGKLFELGLTGVYTVFNKVLNPDFRPYNLYYPRGRYFFNVGMNYKIFFHKFIFSGETAFDKSGKVATLNMLSYSPAVHTSFLLINRYYDKKYQAIYADAFGENSKLQNETGIYIGLESSFFSKLKIACYGDFFHFFYRRYQVDKDHTSGFDGLCQLSYSPINSLVMLIKYSYKNKAKNYTSADEKKYVLPYIRQRLHYQLSYKPCEKFWLKTATEYVHTAYKSGLSSNGGFINGTLGTSLSFVPVQILCSGAWFRTQSYDSRVYMYEPGLLYAFSIPSFYGRGSRWSVNLKYSYKNRLIIQGKWGLTYYKDRDRISSGTEEIQGNRKSDIQLQLKVKW